VGVMRDGPNMLRVCSAWCNSRSQKFNGSEVSAPQRIATKWSLNVWIAFSALFRRWSWGGMSWYVMLLVLMASLKSLEHSLSRICCLGAIPVDRSQLIRTC
jgi:predicted transcriptional regulator